MAVNPFSGRDAWQQRGLAAVRPAPPALASPARPAVEDLAQGLPGVAGVDLDHFLGRPLGDDPAAVGTPVGPQVDDPVGRLHHVEVVLDHDDRVPRRGEPVQHVQQLANVVEMQPGGRLVQDVQSLARPLLDQLARQLDPLRFAAGKRRRGLAELDVIEPDVVQGLKHAGDLGDVGEVLEGLLHVHVEHVADAVALEPDVEGLAAEPFALADRARHPDVGEEVHLQTVRAVAVAGLAPAARTATLKLNRPGSVSAGFRLGKLREQVADLVEQLDVRRRVGTRRAADRRLIDVDHLIEVLGPVDSIVRARLGDCPVQVARSASRRMSPTSELFPEPETPVTQTNSPSGNAASIALQVVMPRSLDRQESAVRYLALLGNRDRLGSREIRPGQALRRAGQVSDRPLGDHLAPLDAGARAEVDEMVGRAHRVFVVLDDDNRVALMRKPLQGCQQPVVVRGCRPIDGSSRM